MVFIVKYYKMFHFVNEAKISGGEKLQNWFSGLDIETNLICQYKLGVIIHRCFNL